MSATSTLEPAKISPLHSQPLTWRTAGLVLFTVALWGGNPVATRYSVDALPPITVSGLRFLMATAVMLVWCRLERVSFRLQWEQLSAVLIAGMLLYLQISLFTIGTQWTSTSHSSLFINTFMFLVFTVEAGYFSNPALLVIGMIF